MKKIILLVSALFVALAATAQHEEPSLAGYYRAPFDFTMLPSANFAETRVNHFHTGVDVKTGAAVGKAVRAIADGYVCRIGIAPAGFGRVLYINHPNGTTSVYAHLQEFSEDIERYVASERYRLKRHNVDLFPAAGDFPVKQGDVIALSGNSGRSTGPHLHFEMRTSADQRPFNPVVRDVIAFKDDIAPTIARIYWIEVDTVRGVPLGARPRPVAVRRVSPGVYAPTDTAALQVGPRGYFVLEVTDRKNDTQNTMGVYRVAVTLDGRALFGFSLDGFLYSDVRYVNSLCHYALQRNSRNQLLRLALQENNRLGIYTKMENRGLVMLADEGRHRVHFTVEDDSGNAVALDMNVRRRAAPVPVYTAADTAGIVVDCRRDFGHTLAGMRLSIPSGSLYESIFLKLKEETSPALRGGNTAAIARHSPAYTVHDASVPLHKAVNLSIAAPDLPENLRPKACLAIVSADGSTYSYMGGAWAGGRVSGSVSVFGRYCVVTDNVKPTIAPSFADGADLRGRGSISFTVRDDFSGVASFSATIDGRWIIFEQNVMNSTITHHFDPEQIDYTGGTHRLTITVTDNRGNSQTLARSFVR